MELRLFKEYQEINKKLLKVCPDLKTIFRAQEDGIGFIQWTYKDRQMGMIRQCDDRILKEGMIFTTHLKGDPAEQLAVMIDITDGLESIRSKFRAKREEHK